jgi:hypothetical protein
MKTITRGMIRLTRSAAEECALDCAGGAAARTVWLQRRLARRVSGHTPPGCRTCAKFADTVPLHYRTRP